MRVGPGGALPVCARFDVWDFLETKRHGFVGFRACLFVNSIWAGLCVMRLGLCDSIQTYVSLNCV